MVFGNCEMSDNKKPYRLDMPTLMYYMLAYCNQDKSGELNPYFEKYTQVYQKIRPIYEASNWFEIDLDYHTIQSLQNCSCCYGKKLYKGPQCKFHHVGTLESVIEHFEPFWRKCVSYWDAPRDAALTDTDFIDRSAYAKPIWIPNMFWYGMKQMWWSIFGR